MKDEKTLNFIDLVERMRIAQKEYFRIRDSFRLREAKELEKAVDTAIQELKSTGEKQAVLF